MWPGVPNPPGYPIWTFLNWLFIHLVPISNIAYRVALASALESALACGLCALIASRFTAFLIEGFNSLESLNANQQSFICSLAGIGFAATSLGLNGTFWRRAVVPSIYPLATLSLVVTMTVLFRWMYSPKERRYLYWVCVSFRHFHCQSSNPGSQAVSRTGNCRPRRRLKVGTRSAGGECSLLDFWRLHGRITCSLAVQRVISPDIRPFQCHRSLLRCGNDGPNLQNKTILDRMEIRRGDDRILACRRELLFCRPSRLDDEPADELGIRAHRRGLLPHDLTWPVRQDQSC